MRFLLVFAVLVIFSSCHEKTDLSKLDSRFYLNKDSIYILEVENDALKHYSITDSTSSYIDLRNATITQFGKDSIQLKIESTLTYIPVEIDTEFKFDFKETDFWSIKYPKENDQEWYRFYLETDTTMTGYSNPSNEYRYFIADLPPYSYADRTGDTLSLYLNSSGKFRFFDQFNILNIGRFGNVLCLVGKTSKDSIVLNRVGYNPPEISTALQNYHSVVLEKYSKIIDTSFYGNWKLESEVCDDLPYYRGDQLSIYKDSIYFLKDANYLGKKGTSITSRISYITGPHSRIFNLKGRKSWNDDNIVRKFELLYNDEEKLKIAVEYWRFHSCPKNDTLTYRRITQK